MGGRHGQETTKDSRGLPSLPRPHPPRAVRRRSGVDHWRATCTERCPRGSAGGRAEKDLPSRHLAARPTQWKAAWTFFYPGDRDAETWVAAQARTVLTGRAVDAAATIRHQADEAGFRGSERTGADEAAAYLIRKAPYLNYATALASGWQIATGIIEGAARFLIKDRMDITGARWSTPGAEAVLQLRAVIANGDFDEYWPWHQQQELRRNHLDRYHELDLAA